jgi:hypothetical protein
MKPTRKFAVSKETKIVNAFAGSAKSPDDIALAGALGDAYPAWNCFLDQLASELEVTVREWRSYSPKSGWALRVKRKARTIVWLAPLKGAIEVVFLLGDKAVRAAQTAGLSRTLLQKVNEARKYPEGHAVRFVISSERPVPALMQLAAIKIAN